MTHTNTDSSLTEACWSSHKLQCGETSHTCQVEDNFLTTDLLLNKALQVWLLYLPLGRLVSNHIEGEKSSTNRLHSRLLLCLGHLYHLTLINLTHWYTEKQSASKRIYILQFLSELLFCTFILTMSSLLDRVSDWYLNGWISINVCITLYIIGPYFLFLWT